MEAIIQAGETIVSHLPDDLLPTGHRLERMLGKYRNLSQADIERECKAFYIQMVLTGVVEYDTIGYYGLQSGWLHRANCELDELQAFKKEIEAKPNKGFFEKLWR